MENEDCRTSLYLTAAGNRGFAEAVARLSPTQADDPMYMWGYNQGKGFLRRRYP